MKERKSTVGGGEISMKKIVIAMAVVLGLNMISSIINLSAPLSIAQETPAPEPTPEPKPQPQPEPEPEPKPEKPGE